MSERTANVAVELDFGEGAPYTKEFPEFSKLSPERKAEVTRNMIDHVSDDIESLTGVKVLAKVHGAGYWMDYDGQPNTGIKLVGSKKAVEEAMSYLGLVLQQTEVYGSKPSIRGTGAAIEIYSTEFTEEKTDILYEALRKAHPDIIVGASAVTVIVDGKEFPALSFGIDVKTPSGLNDADRVKYIENQSEKVLDLIEPILQKLGIDGLRAQQLITENMSVSNDWKKNPNGENYTRRFSDRPEGPSIPERMDSDIVPIFKEKLGRQIAGEKAPQTPELTTQIETEGEGVPQTQNLEPQAVEETKPEIELTNSEKYFAVHGRFPKIPPKDGELSQFSENVFETSPTNREYDALSKSEKNRAIDRLRNARINELAQAKKKLAEAERVVGAASRAKRPTKPLGTIEGTTRSESLDADPSTFEAKTIDTRIPKKGTATQEDAQPEGQFETTLAIPSPKSPLFFTSIPLSVNIQLLKVVSSSNALSKGYLL